MESLCRVLTDFAGAALGLSPCRWLRLTEVIVERAASAKELDLHQQAMAKEASRLEVGAANITLGLGLRICALGR